MGDISKYRETMKTGTIIRFPFTSKRNYRNEFMITRNNKIITKLIKLN